MNWIRNILTDMRTAPGTEGAPEPVFDRFQDLPPELVGEVVQRVEINGPQDIQNLLNGPSAIRDEVLILRDTNRLLQMSSKTLRFVEDLMLKCQEKALETAYDQFRVPFLQPGDMPRIAAMLQLDPDAVDPALPQTVFTATFQTGDVVRSVRMGVAHEEAAVDIDLNTFNDGRQVCRSFISFSNEPPQNLSHMTVLMYERPDDKAMMQTELFGEATTYGETAAFYFNLHECLAATWLFINSLRDDTTREVMGPATSTHPTIWNWERSPFYVKRYVQHYLKVVHDFLHWSINFEPQIWVMDRLREFYYPPDPWGFPLLPRVFQAIVQAKLRNEINPIERLLQPTTLRELVERRDQLG